MNSFASRRDSVLISWDTVVLCIDKQPTHIDHSREVPGPERPVHFITASLRSTLDSGAHPVVGYYRCHMVEFRVRVDVRIRVKMRFRG